MNSLADDFIAENVRALALHGKYVDITKSEQTAGHPAFESRPDLTYDRFDLADTLQNQPHTVRPQLERLIGRVANGELHPLPWQQYPLADAKSAFRFMRSAQHIGKIILSTEQTCSAAMAGDSAPDLTRSNSQTRSVDKALTIRHDRSYLIAGGLGGLGLEVARWLAAQGAGTIGLLARREPSSEEQTIIQQMQSQGAAMVILPADVEDQEAVDHAVAQLRDAAPLAGVFHLAGRLDDGLLMGQTVQQFSNVLGPEGAGSVASSSVDASRRP